jgi:hypothetical protein
LAATIPSGIQMMVKVPHFDSELSDTVISVTRKALHRLIQLLGSFAQVEEDSISIHSFVEQYYSAKLNSFFLGGGDFDELGKRACTHEVAAWEN